MNFPLKMAPPPPRMPRIEAVARAMSAAPEPMVKPDLHREPDFERMASPSHP